MSRRPFWVTAGVAILVLAACSGTSGGDLPTAGAASTISVTSPDLTDGGPIPAEFTCDGADRAPVVMWSGASGPGPIVVLMTDADADGFVHWLVYDLGGDSGTVGGSSAAGEEGHNDFGTNGYRGPCPPAGDGPHHYVISVYQFAPVPSPFAPGEEAGQVIGGSPLAVGTMTGIYARSD